MAGAALLAGASVVATKAYAKLPGTGQDTPSEELAMVMPRQAFPEGDDIPLPKPLSPEISTQIKSIFRLQRQGAFAEAITSTTRLTDATLLGDIEADRYLNPAYHRRHGTAGLAEKICLLRGCCGHLGASVRPAAARRAAPAGAGFHASGTRPYQHPR